MGPSIILLTVCAVVVFGADRDRLRSTPPPQKNFEIDKLLGNWYLQSRLLPCSWSGSGGFTNYVTQYSKQTNGHVRSKATWRSGDCATTTMDLTPQGQPGVYVKKDHFGGMVSGDNIIVAMDYKRFVITWGCTKRAIDGSCSDPRVTVRTRARDPSPHTWKVVETILDHYWKLSVSEMVRVVHDKDACVDFGETVNNYDQVSDKTY